mgnify:FL=1
MNKPISIVILAHNEVEIIETVISEFHSKIIEKLPGSELIIAEDGSTDGTKEILKKLQEEFSSLRWVEGKKKLGYVNAFKEAMKLPKNDIILFCDCSGKHDPNDFWGMYKIIENCDMVIGYKINRADPFYRVIMGKVFNFFVRLYFNVPFIDIDCPLRIFKKDAFNQVSKDDWIEKNLINFEIVLRFYFSDYIVEQVPVKHFPRKFGESRGLPLKKIPSVIFNVLRNFPKLKRALKDLR